MKSNKLLYSKLLEFLKCKIGFLFSFLFLNKVVLATFASMVLPCSLQKRHINTISLNSNENTYHVVTENITYSLFHLNFYDFIMFKNIKYKTLTCMQKI